MIYLAEGKRRKQSRSRKAEPKGRGTVPVRKASINTEVEEARDTEAALRYVVLFLAFCLVFYLVYYVLTLRGSLSLLKDTTAVILGALFSLGGTSVMVNGATVSINGFGLEIIDECTAVFSSIVYCSAVLAYPTTWKNKSLGIAFGVPSLYAINILRLSLLALVGISHPAMFEFVHVYLWQASFIIFVVAIFLLWLRHLEKV
jgi:archaeosortase B (VPXXXP-CTERM-specific)